MKKKFFSILSLMLVSLMATISFSSCSQEPEAPQDETLNKLHDDPTKIVLTLASGHFHDVMFHQDADIEGLEYMKSVQTITYELQEGKGMAIAPGSADKFVVISGDDDIQSAYGLWIRYYNKEGEEITGHFIENGQDQIHQHFFIPKDVKPLGDLSVAEADDNDPAKFFQYTYMDTTPWNKTLKDAGTKLTGKDNPIGMKGWFNFMKSRKTFKLNIRLMHARISKFKDGKTSPFYAPSNAQKLSDHWDINIDVPFIVAHSRKEENDWNEEDDVAYNDLGEESKKMIQAIATAYGISNEQALAAFQTRINHAGAHNDDDLWF